MNHLLSTNTKKVAKDLFLAQATWSLCYAGIFVLVNTALILLVNLGSGSISFFTITKVHLFIIGIISVSLIHYYIRKGVTRKELFVGTALSAIGLSVLLSLLTISFIILFNYLVTTFQLSTTSNNDFLWGFYSTKYATFIVQTLSYLSYYLIGWLIGIGYYRFKWMIGFNFIAFAFIAISIIEFIWTLHPFITYIKDIIATSSSQVSEWLTRLSQISNIPFTFSLVGNVTLICILLLAIRQITRRITFTVK